MSRAPASRSGGEGGAGSERCLRCELCDAVCPTALAPSAVSDRERRGEVHAGSTLCVSCGRCQLSCPSGVAPDRLAEPMKGGFAFGPYLKVRDNLRRFGFVVEPSTALPPPARPPAKAEVAYFGGCLTRHRLPEHALAARALLSMAGVDAVEVEEACCGSPLRRLGEYAAADELLSRTLSRFRRLGAKVVVTSCPGCASAVMEGAPDLEVYHYLEYAWDAVLVDRLRRNAEAISYHLPCHLHRNITPLSRRMTEDLLRAVGDVRRLDHASECCGAGGLVHLQHPQASAACVTPLAREFAASGARRLATLCPSCCLQFRRHGLPAVDLAVVLEGAAGHRGM